MLLDRRRPLLLAALLISSAVAVTTAPSSASPLLPPIVFGQSCVLSGPNEFLGKRMSAGLQAAFQEINANGGVASGRALSLVTYDDGYDPGPAYNNTLRLLDVDNVFALIGYVGTPTAVAALPAVVSRNVPFIGAFTGTNALRMPYSPLTVNLRASYDDETAAMAQLLVGKFSLRRIACFYQNDSFGYAGLGGIMRALSAIKLPLVSSGTYTRNTVDVDAGIASIAAVGNVQAVVMIGTYSALAKFVHTAKRNPGFTAGCHFISVSFVGAEPFAASLDATDRGNVYVTQVVPPPTSATSLAAANYRAAMQAYEGTTSALDFASFEGYLAGRFAKVILDRVHNVTRSAVLQVIHHESIFQVDELPYGLFSGPCANATAAATLGCDCTQGARRVWTTQLQNDGSWAAIDNNFQWGLASCCSPASLVVAPMSFMMAFPQNYTVGERIAAGIMSAFAASNARNIAAGRTLVLQVRYYDNSDPCALSVSSQVGAALAEVYAAGVLGGVMSADSAMVLGTPVFGRLDISLSNALGLAATNAATLAKTSPQQPVVSPTNPNATSVLLLTPPLEEQVLALCEAFVRKWPTGTPLVVVAEPADLDAAVSLVSTALASLVYGMDIPLAVTLPVHDATALQGAVVMLLSENTTTIASALELLTTAHPVESLLVPFTPSVQVCTELRNLSTRLGNVTDSLYGRILIARVFGDLVTGNTSTFLEDEYTADTFALPQDTTRNPGFQAGYLFGRFVAALVARNSGALQSASELLASLYKSSTVAIDTLSFGPFSTNPACQSGLPTFPVQSADGTFLHVFYRGGGCTAVFQPIPPPATPWQFPRWAIGVVALMVTVLVSILVGFFARRWYVYWYAPRDGPYAAMFVSVKGLSHLAEQHPDGTKAALTAFNALVQRETRSNGAYIAHRLHDGCFLIVARTCMPLLHTASALQTALQHPRWARFFVTQQRDTPDHAPESTSESCGLSLSGQQPPARSRRGSRSGSTTSSRHQLVRRWTIGVGVHYDLGSVSYSNRWEPLYTGPAVEVAAVACDEAQPGQIVVTSLARETVLNQVVDHCFAQVQRRDSASPRARVGGVSEGLSFLEFFPDAATPSTTSKPRRHATVTFADDVSVDSVAGALDQAKSGLARRRVAVLCLRVDRINELLQGVNADGAVKVTTEILELLQSAANLQKGSLLSVSGGVAILAFNAFAPTPNAARRAALTALTLRHWFEARGFGGASSCAGIAVGDAYVGTTKLKKCDLGQGSQRVLLGPVASRAATLMRLCGHYAGVRCLALSSVVDDVGTAIKYQQIDRLRGDFAAIAEGALCAAATTDIYSIEDGRSDAVSPEEWLYDLETVDPYVLVERAVSAALSDKTDDAMLLVSKFKAQAAALQAGEKSRHPAWCCPPLPSTTSTSITVAPAPAAAHPNAPEDEAPEAAAPAAACGSLSLAGVQFVEALVRVSSGEDYGSPNQPAWDVLRKGP